MFYLPVPSVRGVRHANQPAICQSQECLGCSDAGHPGGWWSSVEGAGHCKLMPGSAFVLSLKSGLHKRRSRLACGFSFIYFGVGYSQTVAGVKLGQ